MALTNQPFEDVINDVELDHILSSLKQSGLDEVGSREWVQRLAMLEELNVQAALEACDEDRNERVQKALVDEEKLALVVHEILTIELWRQEILPRILKEREPDSILQVNIYRVTVKPNY